MFQKLTICAEVQKLVKRLVSSSCLNITPIDAKTYLDPGLGRWPFIEDVISWKMDGKGREGLESSLATRPPTEAVTE